MNCETPGRRRLTRGRLASAPQSIALSEPLQETRHHRGLLLSLLLPLFLWILTPLAAMGQTTATLSGTVEDASGGVIPGAQVTLTNEATHQTSSVQTNGAGLYAFPALVPGSYTIKASAKGFNAKELTGIDLHAGDQRTVPAFALTVGSESQTVTVEATPDMIPVENGQRSAVLAQEDIENLALIGRDTTELLKVLPGATTVSGGLSNAGASYSDLNISPNQSAIGSGININGAPNRGGTALLSDGVSVIDPGNMAGAVAMIAPEMTQEVTVQATNFGADGQFGPVVVSAISKSGSTKYHGEAYFDARNNILNANDWQDNKAGIKQGDAHYYYPGGNIGGPVPHTHQKLLFWGGYERFLQNQGNANHLASYIPTPEMMAGNFTTDNADNQKLCPQGFFANPNGSFPQGGWCSDLQGTVFPDGSSLPTNTVNGTAVDNTNGATIPAQFLDPGAKALASIWPKANIDPANSPGHVNYYQPVTNINNGWLYRIRVDYNLSDQDRFYVSYQQAYSAQLAQGNGAHIYWTPGNAIPFPGGGVTGKVYSKALAGHFVHTFNSSTTNEFIAAWAYGSFPFTVPNVSAAYKSTVGYPTSYGKVFANAPSVLMPSYSSAGNFTFPDFSQNDIFENPVGTYAVRKEVPSFGDTLTKVWGTHTVKFGGFTQNTDNYQSTFSTYENGDLNNVPGQNTDPVSKHLLGSPHNPTANFVMGVTNGYQEHNSAPLADIASQILSFFVDDNWKASRRLTLEFGARIEHVGHWYDRQGIGMAVFMPERVLSDFNSGKYAPGFYWHGIDPGIPLSGMPNRLAFVSPRFGMAYDVFGTGKTVVRGGWGVYRFNTQVNDVAASLVTSQKVLSYSLPGQSSILLSEIGNLQPTVCTAQCQSGGHEGMDPTDYGVPLVHSYNFTIDQRLKWNTQLDIAYVGNTATELSDNSETIEGSNFSLLADQNKTPKGALFKPVHGALARNPENVGTDPITGASTGITLADYHPYGYAYGTNSVYMDQTTSFGNYNALQVSWIKTGGRLTFNLNGTWSKSLATSLQADPFVVGNNYGPTSIDRPLVFNAAYSYQTGKIHQFNTLVNGALSGWVISGISTWQKGGYIPAALGNGVPNFSLGNSYTGLPSNAKANGITTGIGAPTYFGTDANVPIIPVLTCNPTHGLGHYQVLRGSCFAAPAVGTQGGQNFPYMSAAPYFDNDLAVYKTFPIHDQQNVQFRISAFNWLNHPLPEFSSLTPLTLSYTTDYASRKITDTTDNTKFGVMDTKTQAPFQRILELNVKYNF